MPKWFDLAKGEIGVKERKGKAHNPVVLAYYDEAGHPHIDNDEVPWCAAFVGAMLKRAGLKGTGALTARSYLTWGKPLKHPKEGAIMVFKRGNSSWQGHVAFYVKEDATHYHVLGGNQRNAVNISRYPKKDLLGIRWPTSFATSRTVAAQVVSASAATAGTVFTALHDTTEPLQPVVEQSTGVWEGAIYVALGISLISALATIFFRLQARQDGKYNR